MNKIIQFSIIIPHKNIPALLQSCIDSIPHRDDLEIIVIDDNSDPKIVDFSHFPGSDRDDVFIIMDKNGKGAGGARNLGIKRARGKWLLFADSDDTYTDNLNIFLTNYKNSDSDVIYFKSNFIKENGDIIKKITINDYLTKYLSHGGNSMDVRFGHWPPWNKLIRRSIVLENNIKFDEISSSNDKMFSLKLSKFIKRFEVSNLTIYNYIKRNGSISSSKRRTKFPNYFNTTLRQNGLYHEVGYKKMIFVPLILVLNYKSINKSILKQYWDYIKKYKANPLEGFFNNFLSMIYDRCFNRK